MRAALARFLRRLAARLDPVYVRKVELLIAPDYRYDPMRYRRARPRNTPVNE